MLRAAALTVSLVFYACSAAGHSIYDDELSKSSGTLSALMTRSERLQRSDHRGRIAIKRKLFALSKNLHRMEEDSMRAVVELESKGSEPDRGLLLAASAAKTLDLADSLIDRFLDTGDEVLWRSAVTAAQIARELLAER